jgi:hypothetical protein
MDTIFEFPSENIKNWAEVLTKGTRDEEYVLGVV